MKTNRQTSLIVDNLDNFVIVVYMSVDESKHLTVAVTLKPIPLMLRIEVRTLRKVDLEPWNRARPLGLLVVNTVHYSILHFITIHSIPLQYSTVQYSTAQYSTVHLTALHHNTT